METGDDKPLSQGLEMVKIVKEPFIAGVRIEEASLIKKPTARVDKLEVTQEMMSKYFGMALGVFAVSTTITGFAVVYSLCSDLAQVKEDVKRAHPDVVVLQHRVNRLEHSLLPTPTPLPLAFHQTPQLQH